MRYPKSAILVKPLTSPDVEEVSQRYTNGLGSNNDNLTVSMQRTTESTSHVFASSEVGEVEEQLEEEHKN